ncbi:MAG: SDR family NAD(P)-dependent oxidoreductase [bacterium]|nr:SDR family oxidoreductase [bacterium]MDD6224721.1 SDR family NAD(P)-dependent oxidoreductase [bacterium]MDY3861315.1 SDR family oxidoreductase [Ruminococcus sp.]
MGNLSGKTAVITGGNSGVGAATAMLFAKEGANVVISARRQSALDQVAEKIKAEGGNVITVSTDISKDDQCKALMQKAVDAFGGIDILVNNAGVLDTGLAPVDKFDDDEIQKIISINQVGTMQCIRAALPLMGEGASIVNVASVAGVNGGGGAAYVSTKAAIIGITKHTALLMADKYIRCNAVCPGTIVTPMTMEMKPDQLDMRMMGAMSKHADLKLKPCMAEDVANIIEFFASDRSKALNGQVVVSDFGSSL